MKDKAREVAKHRLRAEGYLRHDLVEDAVAELEAAAGLDVGNPEVLLELSSAMLDFWEQCGRDELRDRARELARAVVEEHPEIDAAYALLQRLRAEPPDRGFAPAAPEGSIPVRFQRPTHCLTVLALESRVEEGWYLLHGWVRNDGRNEMDRLECALELNGRGEVMRYEDWEIGLARPVLRPGETLPFAHTVPAPRWEIEESVIEIAHLDVGPLVRSYATSGVQQVGWRTEAPDGADIEIRERFWEYDGHYQRLELEIRNRGSRPVQELMLDVEFFGIRDDHLNTRRVYVAQQPSSPASRLSSMTPLWSGELRVESAGSELSRPAARYEVSVAVFR